MNVTLFFATLAGLLALILLGVAVIPFAESQTSFSALRTTLQTSQDAVEHSVRHQAALKGTVDWATYDSDQNKYEGYAVELRNADFAHGTLIVRTSCLLLLAEDIQFGPNPIHDFTIRRPQQDAKYPLHSGFQLGFFAAIAITGQRIVLDGQHHSLAQHPMHAILQRFYAHIELASSAFIVGEGPVQFGTSIESARDIIICNTRFGRSSHFAVSGNGNGNVQLRNLLVEDYEVATFKLNGVHDAWIRNVTGTGHFREVPINGEFSQTTFLLQLMRNQLGKDDKHDSAYHRLRRLHDAAKHGVMTSGVIDKHEHPEAFALFANKARIQTGGTVYGFVITDLGAAVGPIQMEHTAETASRRVLIENVRINGSHSHTVEFVSLVDASGSFITGPIGELWDLDRIARDYGNLGDDPLVQAVVRYVRIYNTLSPAERKRAGRPNLPDALLDWIDATNGPLDETAWTFFQSQRYTISCNADAMGHVNKGLMIARIQSSEEVYLKDVSLGDAKATGDPPFRGGRPWLGVAVDPDKYTGLNGDGGHKDQQPMVGYHGNDVHALVVSSSYKVEWDNVKSGELSSQFGSVIGLEQFSPSEMA